MNIPACPCNELPLELLLAENKAVTEVRHLTDHVEQCESCQSRLAELAADPVWWSDAKELLAGGSEYDWRPDESWSSRFTLDSDRQQASLESTVARLLAAPSHPELLGRLGRYDVERVIGSGGMGVVLKAHDSELNRPVAIKLLASQLAHVGAARERFSREGRAAAAVVHEHVVAIYNVETGGEVPFLVMQYVPGRSLQSRVDAEGPLAVEEILRIGMQAASGLAAAHDQGLVHRDVKPSNILLENTVERAVLTDFGLARTIDDASLTHTGVLAGTPHYMSPEQAKGEVVDHRSDLFSLGAVLYFMATGHPPFRADGALAVLHRICHDQHRPVWQTNTEVPDELSRLIDQSLEKSPSRRPASAAEVSRQLAAMLSRFQQYGPSHRRLGQWQHRQLRRPVAMAVAGTMLGAAIIAGSWYSTTTSVSPNTSRPVPNRADLGRAVQESDAFEGQFAGELRDADGALDRSDRHTFSSSVSDQEWRAEIGAIQQKLSQLESTQGIDPGVKE
jgi:eukaryotic-like serine/threonine-protein kinase